MTVGTAYEHIVVDERKVAFIEGTPVKVVELVLDHRAYGWSAEEMHFQHPQLSLGQIHSALAYYWDHRDELDAEVEDRWRRVQRLREHADPSALREKLKSRIHGDG